jgi:DNA-binding MarR family transcriptional regulator
MKLENFKPLTMAKCKEISKTCACFKVRKAARAITNLYDEAFRPIGLRATQCALLVATRILAPVTVVNLAQALVMDRTTLTRNLKVLEKRNLIEIKPGEDRRERQVNLTATGMEVLAKAIPLWEAAQERVRQGLGEEKMHNLLDNLSEMISLGKKK